MATKEFLRKLRQKHHLGEYRIGRKKAVRVRSRRTKRARVSTRRRTRRVFSMARRRRIGHRRSRGMLGGSGSLIKSALIGIGGAHLSGYIPVAIPFKEEAAGAAAAYLIGGKSIKSAAVGAGAVYLTKMMNGTSGAGSGNY